MSVRFVKHSKYHMYHLSISRPVLTMWRGFIPLDIGNIHDDTPVCVCMAAVFSIFTEISTNANSSCKDILGFSISKKAYYLWIMTMWFLPF